MPAVERARKRCDPRHKPPRGDVALPVFDAGSVSAGKVRRSRTSKWRAASLIAIHLLVIGHVIHWKLAGRTLSPVEPSEAMHTLRDGHLNAGFIFFAAVLLLTAILGRFFCGWACHVVAYQDFCAWLMTTLGIKPKPFRSRLLIYVPLLAALYMFVWPVAYRVLVVRGPAPELTNHLATTEFWKTFPGPVIAVLTVLVVGFAAVYFLGAKGFCTYGCPYGGFFGLADKTAPVRIRVTDDCEHCGHCTAVCTSNVRVHEEVARYGMVVDPGCMKCMDCVSVCPNEALYVGVGPPSLLKHRAAGARSERNIGTLKTAARRFDVSWAGETALGLVFLTVLLAFRGLYGWFPFLMSLGMAGVVTYVLLQAWRVFTTPTVTIQNWRPKVAGKIKPTGWGLVAAAGVLALWTAHSAFIQYNAFAGQRAYGSAGLTGVGIDQGEPLGVDDSDPATRSIRAAMDRAHARLERVDRWSLVRNRRLEEQLASLAMHRGADAAARRYLERIIAREPQFGADAHLALGHLELRRSPGAPTQAARASFESALRTGGPADYGQTHLDAIHAAAHYELARLEVSVPDLAAAERGLHAALALRPAFAEALASLGWIHVQTDRVERGLALLNESLELDPDRVEVHKMLAVLLSGRGASDAALKHARRVVELEPRDADARFFLAELLRQLGRHEETQEQDDTSPEPNRSVTDDRE